jgi:hypothetical protein
MKAMRSALSTQNLKLQQLITGLEEKIHKTDVVKIVEKIRLD